MPANHSSLFLASTIGVLAILVSSVAAGEAELARIPVGALRTRLAGLPAPAQVKALGIIRDFRIPADDHENLRVDDAGGVFYVCPAPAGLTVATSPTPVAAKSVVKAAVPISTPPAIHSKPGSGNAIFLDFNGHTATATLWSSGTLVARPFDTDGDETTFSDSEQTLIRRIWERVAEDYAPFDVDVTTVEPSPFTSSDQRAVFTKTTDANGVAMPYSSYGGIAYVGTFGNSAPAWIYVSNLGNREDVCAEAGAHEVGHTLGLIHDGLTNGSEYYGGHGSGETSWAPIMGNGSGRNVTQWSKGEYYLASNTQDDIALIAAHLPFRADDHGDTSATATVLAPAGGTTVSASGIIGYSKDSSGALISDRDVFAIPCGAGTVNLTVTPYVASADTRGGNLDVLLELYNSAGSLIASAVPTTTTGATISTTVASAGTYYLHVRGTGTGTPLATPPTGYTSYGSIGQYTLSGTVVPIGATNLAPVVAATIPNQTGVIGTAFSFTIPVGTFTDADAGDTLTWSASGLPAGLSFNAASRVIAGTPTASGASAVSASVNDGHAHSTSTTFTITVHTATNTAPRISDIVDQSTSQDTAKVVTFTIGDSETAVGSLSVVATSSNTILVPAAKLVLTGATATRTLTITPAANQSGTATITVTVTDAGSLTATDSFVLTVTPASTLTDTTDDQLGTITAHGQNGTVEGMAKAFDDTSATKWLDFSPSGSWIQYRYAGGQEYPVSAYSITSANDEVDRDPRGWLLQGSNDGGLTWSTVDSRTGVAFTARFQKLVFTVSSPKAYNSYRLTINAVQDPTTATSVQLSEIELLVPKGTVPLINTAPVVSAHASAGMALLPTGVTLSATATDADAGDVLSYTWTKNSGPGTVTFGSATAAGSTVTFSAAGTYVLQVSVNDGHTHVVTASVSVTVNAATTGPVVYWKLDDGSGSSASDASGMGNIGSVASGATWTTGRIGGALSCNGSTGTVTRASVSGLSTGNAPHSVAAWVRVSALPANRAWIMLLGKEGPGSHHWLINNAGGTQFGVWAGGQLNPTLPVGSWHHLAMTFDGTTLRGYLDGSACGSVAASFNLTGSPLTLAQAHNGENSFSGMLDDVRVYNRALTAGEVQTLADLTAGAAAPLGTNGQSGSSGSGGCGLGGGLAMLGAGCALALTGRRRRNAIIGR